MSAPGQRDRDGPHNRPPQGRKGGGWGDRGPARGGKGGAAPVVASTTTASTAAAGTAATPPPSSSRPRQAPSGDWGRAYEEGDDDCDDDDDEDSHNARHERPHGGPRGAPGGVRKRLIDMQKEDWAFFCEPCDKGFYTHEKYMEHCEEHIYCPVPGCNFLCRREYKMELHKVLLHDRNNVNLEDTSKYLEERKKRFPTKVRQEKARAVEELRKQRGEYEGRGYTRLPRAPGDPAGGKGGKKGAKGGKGGAGGEPQSRPHLYYKCKKCGRSGHYTEHCTQEANPLRSFRKRSISAEPPEESSARVPPDGMPTSPDAKRARKDGSPVGSPAAVPATCPEGAERGGEEEGGEGGGEGEEGVAAAGITLENMTEEEKKQMLDEDRKQRRLQAYKHRLMKEKRKATRYCCWGGGGEVMEEKRWGGGGARKYLEHPREEWHQRK